MSLLQQNSRRKILLGQDGNALVLLIVFNVIVYIFLSFTRIVYLTNNSTEGVFEAQVLSWFSVPAQPGVFATRPWTLISYMFTHNSVWELISSMIWLAAFGYILQNLSGNRRIIPIYLYSGFAGSIFFLLVSNLIPSISENVNSVFPLLGAGPAIMGIAVATTVLAPRYRIFPMINIPLWVLTVVFVLIRIGTVGPGSWSLATALVAGGLMGYVFVWQLQKGNDWGQWMADVVTWVDDLFNPEKKHTKKVQQKNQLYYKAKQKPYERTPHLTQQRIDDLLDKINHKGYSSLTDEEKDFLKKASTEEL
jgi:membrane associated rhomboid family serine protease